MSEPAKAFEHIILEKTGPVARITINRPDVLNALSLKVLEELDTAIHQHLATDSELRVLVLAGAGEKAFVAGADIAEMAEMGPEQAVYFSRRGQSVTRALETLPIVTIARVQGFALGGGCELAMACDIVIASKKAKFGQPEVNLGLIAGFGGTQRLVQRVGLTKAMDMLCAGRNMTAEEALQAGLVARVAEVDQLDTEVNLCVKGVLRAGPMAVAETKRLVRDSFSMSLDAGLGAEASTFGSKFSQSETREGLRAFLEKRSASFSR